MAFKGPWDTHRPVKAPGIPQVLFKTPVMLLAGIQKRNALYSKTVLRMPSSRSTSRWETLLAMRLWYTKVQVKAAKSEG